MKHIYQKIICVIAMFFLLTFSPIVGYANTTEVPKEWNIWLENLIREMKAKGISSSTLDNAYKNKNYYHENPEVIQKDNKQTEFILTTTEYVNRLVTKDRVRTAREHHKKLSKKYHKIEQKYGVPLNYLISFWAVETNFGKNKGDYHLIDSLTNLSYNNRRSDFFKNELYNVLKIMDKNHLSEEKMLGSWAGAMGHFQFMPSTYNHYAVDSDGDNFPDIWNSFDDAIASAANYLSQIGWKKEHHWGTRVNLPWNFDYKNFGLHNSKKIKDWKNIGIKTYSGKSLQYNDNLTASLILPDGRKGPAYIVLDNFKKIMIWNRSDNYAIAVATLADYIANPNKKWSALKCPTQYILNNKEIETIQKFYNQISHKQIDVDGKLGSKTRAAIKELQKKARLPQDGYPDYRLLNKIKKYNPKYGFSVPVQPQKHKHK